MASLTFTVTGNEPIVCSTLSIAEGVDFVFTRISRINSIVQTTEDVCTISVQSTAEPGDTNPRASTLTAAASFSMTDTAGNAQTTLSGSPQTIWVQRIARPVIALSATTETANLNAVMNGYTVTSTGGTVASYSLTGTLPAGVSFSTTTGRITGTPTAAQTATTYTITATNTSGSTTATFTLTVVRTCANGGTCIVGNTGPGGGIVFYVHAGDPFTCGATLASTCKYLEAAPANWLTGTIGDPTRSWATNINVPSNQITLVLGADGTVIGMGYQNSLDIVAQTGNVAATSAAVEARAYQGNSKTDWHLPSKDELNELCKYARTQTTGDTAAQCDNTGTLRVGFSAAYYWSSSEIDGLSCCIAWPQHFSNGIQGFANDRKFDTNLVRPVRAFG